MVHLLRSTFEQAAAAADEQSVSAEQQTLHRLEVRNMAQGMSWHGEHVQADSEAGKVDLIAIVQQCGKALDHGAFGPRAEDGGAGCRSKF